MSGEGRTIQTADTMSARALEDVLVLAKKNGKITYKVRVYFSNTSTKTISDKIKRILKKRYSICRNIEMNARFVLFVTVVTNLQKYDIIK